MRQHHHAKKVRLKLATKAVDVSVPKCHLNKLAAHGHKASDSLDLIKRIFDKTPSFKPGGCGFRGEAGLTPSASEGFEIPYGTNTASDMAPPKPIHEQKVGFSSLYSPQLERPPQGQGSPLSI